MTKLDAAFLIAVGIIAGLVWCCAKHAEVEVLKCPGGIIGLKEDIIELDSADILGTSLDECEETSMPRYMLDNLKKAQKRVNTGRGKKWR